MDERGPAPNRGPSRDWRHERNYCRQHGSHGNGSGSFASLLLHPGESDLYYIRGNRRLRGAGIAVGVKVAAARPLLL